MRIRAVLIAVLAAGTALSAQQPASPSFDRASSWSRSTWWPRPAMATPFITSRPRTSSCTRTACGRRFARSSSSTFRRRRPCRRCRQASAPTQIEPGGIFTVVLDEIGIQVDDVQAVRRAAQRFFQRDAAAQRSRRRGAVRRQLRIFSHQRSRAWRSMRSRARPAGANARSASRSTGRSRCRPSVESPATIETFGSGENGRNSFRVLAQAWSIACVDSRPPQGDSLVQPRRRYAAEHTPNRSSSSAPVGRDDDVFSRLDRDRRVPRNVAIYTVDPRGLQSAAADLSRDLIRWTSTRCATSPRSPVAARCSPTTSTASSRKWPPRTGPTTCSATSRRRRRRNGRGRANCASRRSAPGVSLLHRSVFLPGSEGKVAAPESARITAAGARSADHARARGGGPRSPQARTARAV